MLAITTVYAEADGTPSLYLRRIADAGFTHVFWSHHGYDDYLYTRPEMDQVGWWLKECGLALLDVHGSAGLEWAWCSPDEPRRRAGVQMVRNRIELVARCAGRSVNMHAGEPAANAAEQHADALRRSLDELEPFARSLGVRIALENGTWDTIRPLLRDYAPEYLGLCYDSGHGNLGPRASPQDGIDLGAGFFVGCEGGLDGLEALKSRLTALHLHDNDGINDLHGPLFSGTVDWPRLANIIAASCYDGVVQMETVLNGSGLANEAAFLAHIRQTGEDFAGLLREAATT